MITNDYSNFARGSDRATPDLLRRDFGLGIWSLFGVWFLVFGIFAPYYMKTFNSKKNPWPYAIAIYFLVFTTFIAVFITWAVRQNMDLVRKDYYRDEMLFQKQLDTVNRTRAFTKQIAINYDHAARAIMIQLPVEHATQALAGSIHFYRPSDAKLDRELKLAPNDKGTQQIDTAKLQPGLWKVRVQWSAHGEEFYFDRAVVIGG